jgi:hypothetical protein
MNGKPEEIGKLEKKLDSILETEDYRYSNKVDFVQKFHLKNNVKTQLTCSISYMACSDRRCLPEKEVSFNISISN